MPQATGPVGKIPTLIIALVPAPVLDDYLTLMQRQAAVQQLYRLTAPQYEAHIAPVMQPLAHYLVASAGLEPESTVLDLGTGTGLAAREAAALARQVVGIDISMPMLRIAQTLRPANGYFVLADAQRLACFPPNSFAAVLSCFGLGETDPRASLRAITRVLKPGGRFALLEWGPFDAHNDPRRIVDDTLAAYSSEASAAVSSAFDALVCEPSPWDSRLQDGEDYVAALDAHGLTAIKAQESRPVKIMLSPAAFMAYALAWAPRRLAVESLVAAARSAFEAALHARLANLCEPGQPVFIWEPVLFHFISVRRSKPCVNACSGL